VQQGLKSKVTEKLRGFIQQAKDRQAKEALPLQRQKRALRDQHRAERERLKAKQEERAASESKVRADKLRKGLLGLIDRVTGKARAIREENAYDAYACAKRDQRQRDELVKAQMEDRLRLQKPIERLRHKHKQDRKLLARDVMQFLRGSSRGFETADRERERARSEEPPRPRTRGRGRGPRFEL
jgi:hypothetical protein